MKLRLRHSDFIPKGEDMPKYEGMPCLNHLWTKWVEQTKDVEVRVCVHCLRWEQRDRGSARSTKE